MRRNTAIPVTLGILLIIAAAVSWSAIRKVPSGSAEADLFPGTFATTQPATDILRVATFNVDGGGEDAPDLHGIADCIRGFDLIGLEEVHGNGLASPPDQAHCLATAVDLPVLYCPVESQYWGEKTFGNALLTDLSVRHWKRIPISAPNSDSNRNAILLRTIFGGKELSVIVTHIDRHGDHAPEIHAVSDLFLSQPAPAILMGDFNCEPNDIGIISLSLTPNVIDPIGKGYDRIFVRGLDVVDMGYLEHHVSDHPMAWAKLRLPTSRPSPNSTVP